MAAPHLRHESVRAGALLVPELDVGVEVDDELPEALVAARHRARVEAARGQAPLRVVGEVLLVHQRLQLARTPPPDPAPPRVAAGSQVEGGAQQKEVEQPQGIHVVDSLLLDVVGPPLLMASSHVGTLLFSVFSLGIRKLLQSGGAALKVVAFGLSS